jgi:hypothetical protein
MALWHREKLSLTIISSNGGNVIEKQWRKRKWRLGLSGEESNMKAQMAAKIGENMAKAEKLMAAGQHHVMAAKAWRPRQPGYHRRKPAEK